MGVGSAEGFVILHCSTMCFYTSLLGYFLSICFYGPLTGGGGGLMSHVNFTK